MHTPIRAGLLLVPELDEEASEAVRRLLRASVPGLLIAVESSAGSQRNWIEQILCRWCDEEELDLVITVGGTLPAPGPSAGEIVPESTLAVVERLLPGVPEAMRAYARQQTELACLDRGVAGIRGCTLILNLPGGAAAAHLFLEGVTDLIQPIVAHVRKLPTAPQIGDDLELEGATEETEAHDASGELAPASPHSARGLNVDEFAEFLRQRKEQSDE